MSKKKQIIKVIKLSSIDKFFTTANIVLVVYSTVKGIEYGLATYNNLKNNALYKEYIKQLDSKQPIGFKTYIKPNMEVEDDKVSDIDETIREA